MKTLDKSRTCVLTEHNSKTQGHYTAKINLSWKPIIPHSSSVNI